VVGPKNFSPFDGATLVACISTNVSKIGSAIQTDVPLRDVVRAVSQHALDVSVIGTLNPSYSVAFEGLPLACNGGRLPDGS
jgi:hypothetical protein